MKQKIKINIKIKFKYSIYIWIYLIFENKIDKIYSKTNFILRILISFIILKFVTLISGL